MRAALLSIATFALAVAATLAFTTGPTFRPQHHAAGLFMSTQAVEEQKIPIVVTGNNIELTEALENYVKNKLERPLDKIGTSGLTHGVSCDVHLVVNKNPKDLVVEFYERHGVTENIVKNAHRVEVTTNLKGMTIRSTEESPDMYASIDAVADRLQRKLVKYKERRMDGYHGGNRMGEELAEAAAAAAVESTTTTASSPDESPMAMKTTTTTEEYVDLEAPQVTKIKSFDLSTPISLQEAIFALDYIDHDFYVFRDAETKEINVVYKRNAGGVGLIQPQT